MKKNFLIMFGIFLVTLVFARQADALSIAVHVPEKYTDVEAGERFYFELEIKYPENPIRKDLRLEYEIRKEGELIAQSKVLKAIETQASFMDFIVIPESAEGGMHNIKVVISDYEDLKEEVSASFHVKKSGNEQLKTYFYILMGVIILVGVMVGIQILVSRKLRTLIKVSSSSGGMKSKDEKVYHDFIGGIVKQMYSNIGDNALQVANKVDGLKVDAKTGKIIDIKGNPAAIAATLVSKYQKISGNKISFFLGKK